MAIGITSSQIGTIWTKSLISVLTGNTLDWYRGGHMNKASDQIIEKIQKLLALANSSNEFEAKLAAERATSLLTKYNLSMQEVDVKDRDYEVADFVGTSARIQAQQNPIFSILIDFFFVNVVIGFKWVRTSQDPLLFNSSAKKVRSWSFFGQRHNVEVAKYVYAFLNTTFETLFDQYVKAGGVSGVNARKSFYLGLARGIREQLKVTKQNVEQEAGLVVVKDPGIADFVKDTIGKTRKMPSKHVSIDSNAYAKGTEEGRNIKIARGLTNEKKERLGETMRIGGSN
jgi:hypothetical protein